MDFIDIPGASGTSYRFRRWPETGAPPPIAGAYAIVDLKSKKLIGHGVLDDVSQARSRLTTRGGGAEIFTRFNVSRATREAEHDDIAQQHPHLAT